MTDLTPAETKGRLKSLDLFGMLACWEQLADKPWLPEVLAIEERERYKRSLEWRLKSSCVAAFKPMTDFDWYPTGGIAALINFGHMVFGAFGSAPARAPENTLTLRLQMVL